MVFFVLLPIDFVLIRMNLRVWFRQKTTVFKPAPCDRITLSCQQHLKVKIIIGLCYLFDTLIPAWPMTELDQNSKFCDHLFILLISLPFTSLAGQVRIYDIFLIEFVVFFAQSGLFFDVRNQPLANYWLSDPKQNFMTYRLTYSFPPMGFAGFMVKLLIVIICIVILRIQRTNCGYSVLIQQLKFNQHICHLW